MTTNEILDRVSGIVHAERVFAPPTEQDGVTVIPAAQIRGGGGGGGGSDAGWPTERSKARVAIKVARINAKALAR